MITIHFEYLKEQDNLRRIRTDGLSAKLKNELLKKKTNGI